MATRLTDTPLAPNTIAWPGIFVPFTAFLKVEVPTSLYGHRTAIYRYMQKLSAMTEDTLSQVCVGSSGGSEGGGGPIFDFVKPISFTPQFGNKPARLTIFGNACKRNIFINEPINEVMVDSDNWTHVGYDASNKSNEVPSATLDTLAKELRDTIESLTGLRIFELNVANHLYGIHGTTLP